MERFQKTLILSLIILLGIALIQSPLPVAMGASNSTKFNVGNINMSQALQLVPNATTSVNTTDTWIFQITVANTTGSAVTFTVQDRAGTPKSLLSAVSIAANTTYVLAFPEGVLMDDGFTWSASSSNALHASVNARRI